MPLARPVFGFPQRIDDAQHLHTGSLAVIGLVADLFDGSKKLVWSVHLKRFQRGQTAVEC
jgi:hypothetical protein